MTRLKENSNAKRHWLNWCRLCANDRAEVNVRQKDVYMHIISKCFAIEIGFEEPELGSMLCRDCYSVISDFHKFMENVNKVQPIFELLRHTEPTEQLDVQQLRQQYGLQESCTEIIYKLEPADIFGDSLNSREGSVEPEGQIYFEEMESSNPQDQSLTPVPVKRKRGRPKGSKNARPPAPICQPLDSPIVYEEDQEIEKTTAKRKRGRPRLDIKTEVLDEWKEPEDEDFLPSPIYSRQSTEEPEDVKPDILVNKPEPKRKRGRPRKTETNVVQTEVSNESPSKCKNLALARLLLASPETIYPEETETGTEKQHLVSCNMCNKELTSLNGLKYHIERVHMKKKPFVCDVCGKSVRTVSELKEHMLVHTEDRPFVCPICNAGFKNRKRLNIHNQTHGEPSYECNICGKKLQTRAIWHKHKNVHTIEGRFRCTICNTATKNSTALKIHLLSHTGLRPYNCKYCNKDFASGANCREHKMKKHPVEYEQDTDKSCRIQCVPTLNELRALAAGMAKGERLRKQKTFDIQ